MSSPNVPCPLTITCLAGGVLSDVIGRKVGMRGRLWWLFFLQMGGAIMCVILGIGPVESKLSHTIGVIIVFSFFIEVHTGFGCVLRALI